MNEKEDILKANYEEYFELAQFSLKKQQYNSATTLFFKAICAITDLFILIKTGESPSSHS